MDKIYIFLADGFEEVEALSVVDILRRAKINIEMVSVMNRNEVFGAHNITVKADKIFDKNELKDGIGIVLPGGGGGTKILSEHSQLKELIKEYNEKSKLVAAICAAPSVLGRINILNGKKAICYPGFESYLIGAKITNEPFVKDGNIITSKGVGTALQFALSIVSYLKDEQTANEIKKNIILE